MRPLLIFYILVIYILAQFIWWSLLLVDMNHEMLLQQVEINRLANPDAFDEDGQQAIFERNFKKKKLMILGEGFVFFCLLVIGIVITHRSFRKEYKLARQQQNFLLSVTHEFKSPLAAIKLNIETLRRHNLENPKRELLLHHAEKETERISSLVNNILLAAQFDSNKFVFAREHFNLSDNIKEIVEEFKLTEPDIPINANIEDDIYILGDFLAIKSMIVNLIENAIKYSPEEKLIEISLDKSSSEIVLKVKDRGMGIAEDDRQKIFQKFYRAGSEITRKTKGTGLGLFIVKRIVDEHRGKIKVSDNHGGGSVFEIVFPLQQ